MEDSSDSKFMDILLERHVVYIRNQANDQLVKGLYRATNVISIKKLSLKVF